MLKNGKMQIKLIKTHIAVALSILSSAWQKKVEIYPICAKTSFSESMCWLRLLSLKSE
jgi:hypothetical protein